MPIAPLFAAADATNVVSSLSAPAIAGAGGFGVVFWFLVLVSAGALTVIVERLLLYHREQIDSTQFLAGVRNVLRRDNPVEAIAICDATPGPVARLMKAVILARDNGRDRLVEIIEEIGKTEVPKLEARLLALATVAQVAPLVGLVGTLLGMAHVFRDLRRPDGSAFGYAAPGELFDGLMQSLYSAALGLALAAVCYAAYNYLVSRVNAIVLDLERASAEALKLAETNGQNGNDPNP
jgi:biopolymer transport protein ExbB